MLGRESINTMPNQTTRVGFWWVDKKEDDIPSKVLRERLKVHGVELVKLDLGRPFEEQGPFKVIVHKLCDMLVAEIGGDREASRICQEFQAYCAAHPEVRILDPLSSVRLILDRFNQYELIKQALDILPDKDILVPPFVRLEKPDPEANVGIVRANRLRFPLLFKHIVAHGSREAHRMFLIMNEDGLRKLDSFPCVVQQYIPHGSVLYKVFVVGSFYQTIRRPSLKDVETTSTCNLIEFNSHDISKPNSKSPLTDREAWLRPDERGDALVSSDRLKRAVDVLVRATKHTLCGIDFILEQDTGKLYVLDFNNFPGFTGVDDIIGELTRLILHEAGITFSNGNQSS
ncbi:inositol-tetrakisphosphate 1-kinase [Galendromus occidentalis]|uniref:Inositol-tetrakisphosphate 1-kinase n=1 Tax=Galendromus occidentalis TaxID=34638 RepID=A0AAJ6QXQ8_9ACAR|nr:inositol-tetrakisphosphate 1-kinase [Galendromus occidentalis]